MNRSTDWTLAGLLVVAATLLAPSNAEGQARSEVEGTVSKLMDFGAFVELESGVEGLIHISELSHKRVPRASDVVHEGEKVKVLVLSADQPLDEATGGRARIDRRPSGLRGRGTASEAEEEATDRAAPRRAGKSVRRRPIRAELVGPPARSHRGTRLHL